MCLLGLRLFLWVRMACFGVLQPREGKFRRAKALKAVFCLFLVKITTCFEHFSPILLRFAPSSYNIGCSVHNIGCCNKMFRCFVQVFGCLAQVFGYFAQMFGCFVQVFGCLAQMFASCFN